LAALHPDIVITSIEPKAIETGQMVAHLLNKPVEISEGLHEHCRANVPFGGIDQFEAAVARFFAQPGDLVFGTETADEAYQRFSRAVNTVSVTHPAKTPAIVTHGTVLALFVSRVAGLRPFPFWQRLGLPAFAVLSVPAFCLEIVVEGVNDQD
jgi:broad specificity phosphatase PhoE